MMKTLNLKKKQNKILKQKSASIAYAPGPKITTKANCQWLIENKKTNYRPWIKQKKNKYLYDEMS